VREFHRTFERGEDEHGALAHEDRTARAALGDRPVHHLRPDLVGLRHGRISPGAGEPRRPPVKLSGAQIAGGVFEDLDALVEAHEREGQSWTTEDVEAFVSSDRKFDAGIFRSGAVRAEIDEAYGVDEFMYFIEGGVTLTSTDGTQTTIQAGDAVMIPREWRGVWDTDGYLKIYVIHYQTPLE